MDVFLDLLISGLLLVGGFFALIGAYGLVKLPDLMSRLHAPTKATTLGVGGVLIASMLYFARVDQGLSWHELLITVFLFLTAPLTAHMVAKAYLHRDRTAADALPPSSSRGGWATLDDDERGRDPTASGN